MRRQRIALVVGLGIVVAACVATKQDEPGGSTAPAGPVVTPPPAPAPSPVSTPTVASLTGPRVFDWSSPHVTTRATHGVSPSELLSANGGGHGVDWNVTTGSPVTAAAAVYGSSWVESTPNQADMLFFGVKAAAGTGGGITGNSVFTSGGAATQAPNSNFFGLTHLYGSSSPVLAWSISLSGGGLDGAGVSLSIDGTKVFVVDTSGTLHCVTASNGTTCASPWSDYSFTGAGACSVHTHGSGPWVDYTNTSDIYFGDDCGWVHRVNGSTGAQVWSIQPGLSATYQGPFESSPVVFNGYVFIGDDLGQLFRLTDTTASAGPSASGGVSVIDTCSAINQTAPCPGGTGGPWAIRTSISYDTINNHVYTVADDYVFELTALGTFGATSASPKKLNSGGTGPMYSSPVLDPSNGYLYTGLNSKLFKLSYPFAGNSTSGVYGAALAGGSGTNPPADALPYNNVTYVGDSAGQAERFSCGTLPGVPAVNGQTTSYGVSVNTSMSLDYSTGNVNFGYTATGGTTGGLVQYPLGVASYACPSGTPNLCTSSNGPTNTCSESDGGTYGEACRQCCTTADCSGGASCVGGVCVGGCGTDAGACPVLPNAVAACTSGACSYTCSSGFANCDGSISTNGCNVTTSTDVNNCGACGNACSNSHIPTPVCTAGVCAGHCADGWVDCDSNRQSNGCESPSSCGSCCGAVCATGTTCYDNGATGTCATGQTTQAYNSAYEFNAFKVSCPSGQTISSIPFADYGAPNGVGGQSWMANTNCSTNSSSGACTAVSGCTWTGSACITTACWNQPTQTACGLAAGCSWSTATGTCTTTTCFNAVSSTTCATAGCTWDTALSVCTASEGFLHDYGTSPNNTYLPNCAMDVSAASQVTSCIGTASCTLIGQPNEFGSATNPTSPTNLPLNTSGGYPGDPCPSLAKSLAVQAQCGACVGAVAAYSDLTTPAANQTNFAGSLGMDFTVNSSIEVTSMGAYDSNSDKYAEGTNGGVVVAIYTSGGSIVSGTQVTLTPSTSGLTALQGGDRFLTLSTPVVLGPGNYSVVAFGYRSTEPDYNSYGANNANTTNTGGGLLTFTGSSRYDQAQTPALTYPTTLDSGPANRYRAGTFQFLATPPGLCTVGGGVPPCQGGSSCTAGSNCISTICENTTCNGNTITYDAYADVLQTGSQQWTGSLGMTFTVNNSIAVTQMGAFDSNGDGFNLPIRVGIFTTGGTPAEVAGTDVTMTGTTAQLVGGDRFTVLGSPVLLAPGNYMILAQGYGVGENNNNSGVNGGGTLGAENTGGGAITFTGTAYYGNAGSGFVYPTNTDNGPANRYAAGTFLFH